MVVPAGFMIYITYSLSLLLFSTAMTFSGKGCLVQMNEVVKTGSFQSHSKLKAKDAHKVQGKEYI